MKNNNQNKGFLIGRKMDSKYSTFSNFELNQFKNDLDIHIQNFQNQKNVYDKNWTKVMINFHIQLMDENLNSLYEEKRIIADEIENRKKNKFGK